MLRLERRPEASQLMSYASPLIAIVLMLIGGLALFVALGKDPVEGFKVFFLYPISDAYGVSELLLNIRAPLRCTTKYRYLPWSLPAGHCAGDEMLLRALKNSALD